MNADENRIARRVGNFRSHFQRHKIIAFASHDHPQSFRLQNRAELSRDIQGKIFFRPVTAHLPFVVPAVSGIENDRLNVAHIWNTVWPDERLNGFGYVSARHQRFSVLFDHGEAQPTSSALDDGFPAAADEFQRTISGLFLYFRPGRDDLCGQFVKLGNIVHAQIIVAIYLDYLPLGSSNRD